MDIREIKKLVNINKISDDAESCGLVDVFEEDVELLVMELDHSVWSANRNVDITEEAEEYLNKLQKVIRKELVNCVKTLKYKNLEI